MKKSEIAQIIKEEYNRAVLNEVRRIRNDTFKDKEVSPFVIASAEAPLIDDINDAFHSWWVIYSAIQRNRDVLRFDDKSLGSKCNKINTIFNTLRDCVGDLMTALREVDQEMTQAQNQPDGQPQVPQNNQPDSSADIS